MNRLSYTAPFCLLRILLLVVAGMALLLSAAAYCQPMEPEHPLISGIHIDIVDYPDPRGELTAMARGLLRVTEGGRFSEALIDDSIHALQQTGRFQRIHADSSPGVHQIELVFTLTPYPLIKAINIPTAFPVLERTIRQNLTIISGDIYTPEKMPLQIDRTVQLFESNGFIAPTVRIEPKADATDGNVSLTIVIDRGVFHRLGGLTFEGNRALSSAGLKRRMKIWRVSLLPGSSGRFIRQNFKRDLRELTAHYRKQGYVDAQLHPRVTLDKETQRVDVVITVEEGPHYRLAFTGNQSFSDRVLRKEVVIFTQGNRHGRGARNSVKNILAHYRKSGFRNAQVNFDRDQDPSPNVDAKARVLRFRIDEGPRTRVQSLSITGNVALDETTLRQNILTRPPGVLTQGGYSTETLEQDVRAVKLRYLQAGFLDTQVYTVTHFDASGQSVEIELAIDEGVQTRVTDTRFAGLNALTRNQALEAVLLTPGEAFQEFLMESDANTLAARISEQGYPHVTVHGQHDFTADRTGVTLTYRIDQGPHVRMGNLFTVGNFRTRAKVITRESEQLPGDPLVRRDLLKTQRNIRNLEIFDAVRYRTIGFEEKREKVDLVVEVAEKKPFFMDIGGGWASDRGIFINGRLGDRNLAGRARRGWVEAEISEIGHRLEADLLDPRLFDSEVTAALNLYTERREEFNQPFGTVNQGGNLGFKMQPWQKFTAALVLNYAYRDQFSRGSDRVEDQLPEEDFDGRHILVASPSLLFDSRDSLVRPREGIFSVAQVDLSRGLENDLDNFARYQLDGRYFFSPFTKLTMALIGRLGYIDPQNGAGIVSRDQLFYLGGIRDVRGFGENLLSRDADGNALGGLHSIFGSVEARFDLGGNWELPLFVDGGQISQSHYPLADEDLRYTVGTGLRYHTPIGPVGILYGYKLNRRGNENAGRFHFAIGYTF